MTDTRNKIFLFCSVLVERGEGGHVNNNLTCAGSLRGIQCGVTPMTVSRDGALARHTIIHMGCYSQKISEQILMLTMDWSTDFFSFFSFFF